MGTSHGQRAQKEGRWCSHFYQTSCSPVPLSCLCTSCDSVSHSTAPPAAMFFSRLAALSVRLAEDLGSRLKADKDVCQIPGGPVPPPSLNPNTKVTKVVGCSGQIPPLSQSLIHELTKTGQSACAAVSQVSLLHAQCLPCKQDKVTKSRLSAPVKQALSLPYHCSHRHHP